MSRGRKPLKDLSFRDKKIVERYNSTFETMAQLAKRYGITKQRVHEILMRAKNFGYDIEKPKLTPRHHDLHQCRICQEMIHIARENEVMTRRQLAQRMNLEERGCYWHLTQLKRSSLIPKNFASLRSERLAKALQYYKQHSLSKNEVGKIFGYKNFYSIIIYQEKKGINLARRPSSPGLPSTKQEREMLLPRMSHTEF